MSFQTDSSSCHHRECHSKGFVTKQTANLQKDKPKRLITSGVDHLKYIDGTEVLIYPRNITSKSTNLDQTESGSVEVERTKSKIHWNSKPSTSKYHKQCIPKNTKNKAEFQNFYTNNEKQKSPLSSVIYMRKEKFKNECYCTKSTEKINTPKSSPKKQLINKNIDRETIDSVSSYNPTSNFLTNLKNEINNVYNQNCSSCKLDNELRNLKFTKRRQDLEDGYENNKTNEHLNHCTCLHTETNEDDFYKNDDFERIKNVKYIRQDNYFDTHSLNDIKKEIDKPEHVCYHQFEFDGRLLPKPVNTDVFGLSRCTICNKPMEFTTKSVQTLEQQLINSNNNKIDAEIQTSQIYLDNQQNTSNYSLITPSFKSGKTNYDEFILQNNVKKIYRNFDSQNSLTNLFIAPREIPDSKNEIIGLKFPKDLLANTDFHIFNRKFKPSGDSWALQHQKGVSF